MSIYAGKSVMVTGACGTIGAQLVKQLLANEEYAPKELIGIDNNESALFFLDQLYLKDSRARFFVTDIRDRRALTELCRSIDVVFHTAALKHVILSERSPEQAVQTNIEGVQNIISAANHSSVEKVIFTSSDKAVNPTNVMGTSKLMGERLITAANSNKRESGRIFVSTRFGNVLGSNGSVIPIFRKQIAEGGPVTLTHPDMSRFVMSVLDSVLLVLDSAELAKGGEVFVTKMPTIMIKDLAEVMIECLAPRYNLRPGDIEISEIGVKPGEKLYEELMNTEETRRTIELKKYFSVLPAFLGSSHAEDYRYPDAIAQEVREPYNSSTQTPLDKDQLVVLLRSIGTID